LSAPIATGVAALKAGMAEHAPAEILSAFGDEQEGLRNAGIPAGLATPGTLLPDGKLLTASEAITTLAEVRDGRPAVVVLYRGAWCPFCNLTLRTYETELAATLQARGVALIAVSPQRPDGAATMEQTNGLSFTVLSDPANQLARQLGVLTGPTDAVIGAQSALGLDLTEGNADGTRALPMPTTVVIDQAGIIRWIDVHPDYTSRSEPAAILAAVDALES
jgi:peroxiredoxin